MRISDWSSDVCSSDLAATPTNALSFFPWLSPCERHNRFVWSATAQCVRPERTIKMATFKPNYISSSFCYFCASSPGLRGYCQLRTRRSEEHTSELQSLMRISYAVFCLKKKIT